MVNHIQSILLVFGLVFSSNIVVKAQNLEFEETEEGVMLLDNGQPRYFYQKLTKSQDGNYPRAHYFHPVYDINGGIITEDFPEDHPHQRGIFWAWHQLYEGDKKLGNGWLCEDFVWDVRRVFTNIEEDKAYLKSVVFWMNKKGEEFVVESMETIYTRIDSATYEIDFEIRLQALKKGIRLGGSEDEKGYGGFSARITLPEDIAFEAQGMPIEPENEAMKIGSEIRLIGTFDPNLAPYQITLSAEQSTMHTTYGWILRKKDSMQNYAFPGNEPIPLSMEEPLVLRNKLTLHHP